MYFRGASEICTATAYLTSGKDDIGRMEIRLLYGNELQWAVYTANEVFENCIRPYARTREEVDQYYRYVQTEYLWQEMSAGRLFLWGAFENGQMCAVSAMQNVGHITMLYVRPYYGRRRVGTQLLNTMCSYAATRLGKARVTVNVMPVSCASYFYHMGFTPIQGSPMSNIYISLERRTWMAAQGYARNDKPMYGNIAYTGPNYGPAYRIMKPEKPKKQKKTDVTYPTKKVSTKLIVGLAAGVLVFSVSVIAGITIHHMVKEGLVTESGYDTGGPDGTEGEFLEGLGAAEEL